MKVFLKSFKVLFKHEVKKNDFSWRLRNDEEKESRSPLEVWICEGFGERATN